MEDDEYIIDRAHREDAERTMERWLSPRMRDLKLGGRVVRVENGFGVYWFELIITPGESIDAKLMGFRGNEIRITWQTKPGKIPDK